MRQTHRNIVIGVALATIATVLALTGSSIFPSAIAETAGSPTGSARLTAGAIASGYAGSCVVLQTGAVQCWGAGDFGANGNGSPADIGDDENPVTVGLGGATATSVSMRYKHACAVLSTGKVRCWGLNVDGELGIGSVANIGDDELPTADVTLATTATAISAGWHGTCALLTGGAVNCWGRAGSGQLGNGVNVTVGDDESVTANPNVDLGGHTATAITSGRDHSCAILDDGNVSCWGANNVGQLGLGTTPANPGATVDLGGRMAVAIAAGYESTCAILDNGALLCWGRNDHGELGLGNTNFIGDDEAASPTGLVELGAGLKATNVSLGYDSTCAVLDNGSTRCWGTGGGSYDDSSVPPVTISYSNGNLGLGSPFPDLATPNLALGDTEAITTQQPINVGGNVSAVSTGTYATCALLADANVKCWGNGSNGRLGYGNTDRRGDDETPAEYGNVVLAGVVGAVTTPTTAAPATTTTTVPATAPPTTAATVTQPPATQPPATVPPAPAPAPAAPAPAPTADTTAPELRMWHANPISVGANSRVCVFLTSNEVAITGVHIKIGKAEYRSAISGVGPANPQFLCISLPKSARPKKATQVVLTAAAVDIGANVSFDIQRVTIVK